MRAAVDRSGSRSYTDCRGVAEVAWSPGGRQDDEDKPRGFGFVNFESADEAATAVEKLQDHELEGRPLFCGRAQKKSEREANLKQK